MGKKTILAMIIVLILSFAAAGCGSDQGPEPAGPDEIKVRITLDLKEDIGLLITDYTVNGETGSGGVCNIDKSMIRKDSTDLDWTYCREVMKKPTDTADVFLQFTVVTKYFDPNYENIYPEEYKVPMEPVAFTAKFGDTLHVTITGDKANGYQAVLDEP